MRHFWVTHSKIQIPHFLGSLPFLKFATNEAIQRTEAYEYAQSLGVQASPLPNFQVSRAPWGMGGPLPTSQVSRAPWGAGQPPAHVPSEQGSLGHGWPPAHVPGEQGHAALGVSPVCWC